MDKATAKMAHLGYRASEWMIRPTAELVAEYERRFALRLPHGYRRFLLRFGGYAGSAYCPLQELSPYEDPVDVSSFLGFWPRGCEFWDIRSNTEWLFRFAPPVFAPIASASHNNCVIALQCSGSNAGRVYLFDDEGRAEWADDILERPPDAPSHLQHRHASMKRYFELRRAGRLPAKPEVEAIVAPSGVKTLLFRLAGSFEEFLDALQRPEERFGGIPPSAARVRVRGNRPLNRLYRLLCEAGDRPYAIDFDRRRRVIWFTCGEMRAGAGEENEQIRVSYQSNTVDIDSDLCTPEQAAALIEALMARKSVNEYVARPRREPDEEGRT